MKSFLLWVSLACLSLACHAQPSITLAGTADATITRGTGSVLNRTQLGSGGNSTSKFIIRGVEDLGGGLAALFWLEAGFLLDTGTGQATNPNNNAGAAAAASGFTFNRRSIVGLRGHWGEVHLGRDWSPMYDAYTAKFDPFGVSIGLGVNYTASPTSVNGAVRMSNAVGYTTPKFGGASANVQRWYGENPGNTATSHDGSGQGIRLNYDEGRVAAVAHWGRTNYAAGDAVYRAVALTYDFGPFKAGSTYNNDRQGNVDHKGLLLAAWVPVGVGEFKFSYSKFRSNAPGDPKASKLALGYVHNLSKRTAVYTTVARLNNGGGSRIALGGATTGPNESSSGIDLGVRHNF